MTPAQHIERFSDAMSHRLWRDGFLVDPRPKQEQLRDIAVKKLFDKAFDKMICESIIHSGTSSNSCGDAHLTLSDIRDAMKNGGIDVK